MKKRNGFLGTIYGIDIKADTKDLVKLKIIGNYLERARQALMEKELSTGINWKLKDKIKNKYMKSICQ